MDQPTLPDIAKCLEDPGTVAFLCEIHIPGPSAEGWQCVLDLVRRRSDWTVEYTEAGEVASLPDRVDVIFERCRHVSPLLRIVPIALSVHAHFFTPVEIEFDVSARDVDSQARLDELVDFAREVGRATERVVLITAEGAPDVPCLRYDPLHNNWTRP